MKPLHEQFAKEYVANGNNATQAVKKVFKKKDDNVSAVKGSRLLRNDKVKAVIKSIADQIPDDLLVETHLAGLKATKKVFKNNNESGEIEQVGEEADYPTRHKYLDTGYKIKGNYAPEKVNHDGSIIVVKAYE
jgi:hypothetical protein